MTSPITPTIGTGEILAKARGYVEQGWTQEEYSRDGRVCAMGAIYKAVSGNPEGVALTLAQAKLAESAKKALGKAAGSPLIINWNDKQRSKKPVIEAFKLAEALVRQEK